MAMGGHGHPYSPAELELPGFVPQRLSQGQILAPFVGTAAFSVLGAWLISGRCGGGRLSGTDRLLMGWWVFTALTHIVFEPPFLFTPDFLCKENPNYFDEMFKEYNKGDSRYAARNTAILALEVITVGLKGPASLLAVLAAMRLRPGSRTATSSSSPSLCANYTDAWFTSSPHTWMASTSGSVRSTSGHISSVPTVRG